MAAMIRRTSTLVALGIQVLISGDDNFNSTIAVRYRPVGQTTWRDALPLFRVHPDVVTGHTVPPQFAGSIFNLRPATTYDIELHALQLDLVLGVLDSRRAVACHPAGGHTAQHGGGRRAWSAGLISRVYLYKSP